MSLTKRHIDDLTERAQRGDEEARRTLEEAGLWHGDEDEYPYYHPDSMDATTLSNEDLMM
jgi:hypothetical protein